MWRMWKTVILLCAAGLIFGAVNAQSGGRAQQGDPPSAALITISNADEDGIVTVTGAAGAVFPNAQVIVRNLYTEDTAVISANISGAFTAQLYGPGSTPFWISAAANLPNALTSRSGSLPGGPGTILYGSFPEAPPPTNPVTALLVDGSLDDWAAYPQSELLSGRVYALLNADALLIGIASASLPANFAAVRVTFALDGAVYALTVSTTPAAPAPLRRLDPSPADLSPLPTWAAAGGTALELRIPWQPIAPGNPSIEQVSLNQLEILGAPESGTDEAPVLDTLAVGLAVPTTSEQSGIVRLDSSLGDSITRFSIGGVLGGGASRWQAQGRTDNLNLQPGDTLRLELDVTLALPDLPADLVALGVGGRIGLQRVVNADGSPASGGVHSNNGWSGVLTAGGLPIDNVNTDLWLGEVFVPPAQVIHTDAGLTFALDFALPLPADLPAGIYVPIFEGSALNGSAQNGSAAAFRWTDSGIFGTGTRMSRVPLTRLPLALNIGAVGEGRLPLALFYDTPSDGSRGVLPAEDAQTAALSNRVHYNSATYILPPGSYPLEPYLPNLLPNAYDSVSAPLLPLFLPGGRLNAAVTAPDGTTTNVGSAAFVQNRLSTDALDERTRFGAQTPVDTYRLTTLNPEFTAHAFEQYGEYAITLTASVEDIWGNRYSGGGTYRLLIAEALDLRPGVLPGTPFAAGDAFNPSVMLAPAVPADILIRVRYYPIDGGVLETVYEGRANAFGYFHPGAGTEPLRFSMPGEYVIDYEARFTDSEGRLWAASQRSAGVIADTGGALVAHGERGFIDPYADIEPAWFNSAQYPPDDQPLRPLVNTPYHSGDVAWTPDGVTGGVNPLLSLQDADGAYTASLQTLLPDYRSPRGLTLARAATTDALPVSVAGGAYGYVSAVRPGVTVRQFIQGGDGTALSVHWDNDDPLNGQMGAGAGGMLPGDYTFVFGGVVARDTASGVFDTAGYAALAVVNDSTGSTPLGARVYPPARGADGGPDGGALLRLRGENIDAFFHPTGVVPGQVLVLGDTLVVAGQAAPTLAANVSVTITAPSGVVRAFSGVANPTGYFYDPAQDFAVDETGIWTVQINISQQGHTAAGQIEPPYLTGTVLGAVGGQFPVYVVADDAAQVQPSSAVPAIDEIQAAAPLNFALDLPQGWQDYDAFATVTMPGYLLRTEQVTVGARSFTYQYNVGQLSRDFPNLETDGRPRGTAGSDVVTVTLVVTGIDDSGRPQTLARVFTVMHDRLLAPE